ncbi:MAG: DNA internalization-related competence protein ComEC/Rec2 [Desulfovibrionales bacterium]|nr:DNA internalization-related competence protein ComEC/Rec2 [Desulfovibrionales bacterium]
MNRLLPILLTAFVTGLVLNHHLPFKGGINFALGAVSALVAILFYSSYLAPDKRPGKASAAGRTSSSGLLLSWLLFVCLGYLHAGAFSPEQNTPRDLLSLADGRSVRLAGVLEKMPVFLPDRTELLIRAEQYLGREEIRSVTGRILVRLKDRPPARLACGDRVLWMGSLRPVINFKNPGGFDFEKHMALKDVYVTGWVSDPHLLTVIGKSGPFEDTPWRAFSGLIEGARLHIQSFLDNHATPLAASLYKALLIGERGGIPKPVQEAFTRAGVTHILAISGLHMGMVAGVTYALGMWLIKLFPYLLLRFPAFKIAALFSIPIVLFYGAMAGLSPPSTRAMVMVSVFLAAVLLGRQWDIYNNLAIAMWAILLFSPAALYAPSFQLSFIAVFSIVFFYPRRQDWLDRKRENPLARLRPRPSPFVDKLWGLFLISAIATLGTAPIVVYHFHRLSIVGLLSNVIVVPLVGMLALPLGLVSVALSPLSLKLADIFLQAGSLSLTAMVKVIDFFAACPFSSLWVTPPCLFEILLFYAGVLFITMASRRKAFRWCGLTCLSIILVVKMVGAYQQNHSDMLRTTFLDVGQGNAALVQFPGGKNMIIDGGGTLSGQFDIGERVIAPFLRTKGVWTIDYLVLTHPHPDHIGGLIFLLDNFKVKEVWANGDRVETEAFVRWQQAVSHKGIPHREFKMDSHYPFNINGVMVDVYGPPRHICDPSGDMATTGGQDVLLNRRSLVLRISYGRRHLLFPGDIDACRENELSQEGYALKSDVLLAPHHGSNTSNTPEFIRAVAPDAVVFSVGQFNRFSFPHPDVVGRYMDRSCSIYRTDRDGAITCLTDGHNLQIEPFSR